MLNVYFCATSSHQKKNVKDDEVATLKNGVLSLHLIKDSQGYKSARLYAHKGSGWRYGYIEARLRLPKGKGTWPAFWMMPVNFNNDWPASGEIDIMEHVGLTRTTVPPWALVTACLVFPEV